MSDDRLVALTVALGVGGYFAVALSLGQTPGLAGFAACLGTLALWSAWLDVYARRRREGLQARYRDELRQPGGPGGPPR